MKLRLDDGTEFRAVNLNTARGRDVIALQTETGKGIDEFYAMGEDPKNQAYLTKVVEYLSERNRGMFLTFDEILDRTMPTVIPEPGDPGVRGEVAQDDEAGPTAASTASLPVDADAAHEARPSTPASSPYAAPSDGSTSRSIDGSSTS
ncbi:hypothetical protein [Sanguibacter sp. HDW7]|uniref:hypothetical protein n=1 Tax=Sanguibacter sp. HDW7 TaxID=2714931 RepID=UPI00140BB24C|nr:hypothetical protein [Sanguibacter sp. HDW7]QIK83112.1 hypothetical protein G7063_05320 [Sanguibacter sp. HDW7]